MSHPTIDNRKDLAEFLGVPVKYLTSALYVSPRATFYREFQIPKSNGGTRTLHASSGRLKALQRRALDRLQSEWSPSPFAHGFVPQRSIITNAFPHQWKKRTIKIDIQNFFPSITFPRVLGMFQATPFSFGKEASVVLAQLACIDDSIGALPQGSPLSPYIANMICRRMDSRLAKLAKATRCHFTRYADDITFSTNDVKGLERTDVVQSIYQILESENFTPNKEKTRILFPKDRQVVTGLIVNDGLNVNRRYLRNVRALLHNCEVTGIEAQVTRSTAFLDDRTSRTRINGNPGNFSRNGIPLDDKDACQMFLWHLLGKIDFVGQVVSVVDCESRPHLTARKHGYEALLWSMHKLLDSRQNRGRYPAIENAVKTRIAKNSTLEPRLGPEDRRLKTKDQALRAYRANDEVQITLGRLKKTSSVEALTQLCAQLGERDARFFGLEKPFTQSDTSLDLFKQSIIEKAMYPAISLEKTIGLLRRLRQSHGFGALTHEVPGFTPAVGWTLLLDNFYPIYYELPRAIQTCFDKYAECLLALNAKDRWDSPIDVTEDPAMKEATISLKLATRFGNSGVDHTSLADVIHNALDRAQRKCESRKKTFPPTEIGFISRFPFYTSTENIKRALDLIFYSMLKNSRAAKIIIETKHPSPDYLIIVRDNCPDPIDVEPGRSFLNGKLLEAITLTNGSCKYEIEATFRDGRRYFVDMHSGSYTVMHESPPNGFVHRLSFSVRKS